MDTGIFEIAAYRLSRQAWRVEREQRIRKRAAYYRAMDRGRLFTEDTAEQAARAEDWRAWRYNEVVGWISLQRVNRGVKAYLYPVVREGGGRLLRRRFAYRFRPYPFANGNPNYLLFETLYQMTDTDESFVHKLRARLMASTQPGEILAGRHLDLRCFDRLAPHIRWRDVL